MSGIECRESRIKTLDGLRGYFLVFMMVNHMKFKEEAWLALVNHSTIGYVQDAQGFIFISGMLVGLVYSKGYEAGHAKQSDKKLISRALLLFKYNLAAITLILLIAIFSPTLARAWDEWLYGF